MLISKNSALFKDFYRELSKSKGRFLSIFCIVLLGVAFFSGVKATAPDMRYTADKYYDEYRLMDFQIMSSLGLTDNDIEALRNVENVHKVQPGYFTDAVTMFGTNELVIHVESLPSAYLQGDTDIINQVNVVEGRLPQTSGECVMENSKVLDLGYKVGDTIHLSSGLSTSLLDGVLKTEDFTIVGFVETPFYLTYDKGTSNLGNGTVNFFMMIPEDDFAYEVYTQCFLEAKGAREMNTFSKKYTNLIDKLTIALENIGADRSTIRVEEIKDVAYTALDEAQKQYDDAKKKYNDEILAAEKELTDAYAKLIEGETTLEREKKSFEEQYAAGQAQIAMGEQQLAEGERQYNDAKKQYDQAMEQSGDVIEGVDQITTGINDTQSQSKQEMANIQAQLEDETLTDEERASLETLLGLYGTFLDLTKDGVDALNGVNNLAQLAVDGTEQSLKQAKQELDSGRAELARGRRELEEGKAKADEEFAKAELQLTQGWSEYNGGYDKFQIERAKGQQELDAALEQLLLAENEIEKLAEPTWYVLNRDLNRGCVDFKMTAERVDALAQIFPVFFFLVAALVCSTTMTRMVDEQRGTIGCYKALGYSNGQIAFKYVCYAGVASVLGGIIGLTFGLLFFPKAIFSSWSMMYTMPELESVLQIGLMFLSVLMGVSVTVLTAYLACMKELIGSPSLLMRPKPPKQGKAILLEKITWLWTRLSFSQKVTMRNIFRYKKRFWMTVIGITGCTALLLAGFGLNDSVKQVVHNQYKEVFTYNLQCRFTIESSETDRQGLVEMLSGVEDVESLMRVSYINAKIRVNGNEESVSLVVPTQMEGFDNYITLRTRETKNAFPLPETGIVLTEKLAKELGVGIGDMVQLENAEGILKKVEVNNITENYVFHYAYMHPESYKDSFRIDPQADSLLIRIKDATHEKENWLGNELSDMEAISSVTFYSEMAENFSEQMDSLNGVVVIIIICAGLLAFVVLYNLTNINVSERLREIATIKVLGFYNSEVVAYVYRENILLTIIGALFGLGVGKILHAIIMVNIESEAVMFGNYVKLFSYGYSFVITLIFSLLVCLFMYKRLTSIPMVESLKSVE